MRRRAAAFTKRIGCFATAVVLMFTGSVSDLAGTVGNVKAAEAVESQTLESRAVQTPTAVFDQSYGKVGEKLSVSVTGVDEGTSLTYVWSSDGKKMSVDGNSYTLTSSEQEKLIHVDVYETGSDSVLCSTEMFISNLPVVYVNTENGVGITSKETYVSADMDIQGSDEYNTNLYNGSIQIRGRGNATWSNPKKPYKLKLDTSSNLFGMGKSKHWVLLANYVDPSLIRNKLAYDLSGAMGMPYMQSVNVELILNGSYVGNYLFCEQVKLEESRVNIEGVEDKVKAAAKAISKKTGVDRDSLEEAMLEDLSWITSDSFTFEGTTYKVSDYYGSKISTTGGFLLELDYYQDEVSMITTSTGKIVKFKNPEYAVTNDEMYSYVEEYLNAFESAISSDDFHTQYLGEDVHYSDLFDMDSLVKFWLIQEIFFNWDGMNNSNYIYKDVDGKMYFGPIWDMDLTAGSNNGTTSTTTWQTFGFTHWQHPGQWYRSITKDPYFIVQAYSYYQKIRGTLIEDMQDEIATLGSELALSGQKNMDKWHSKKSYTSQISSLQTWMEKHLAWLDQQFTSPETIIASLGNSKYNNCEEAYGYTPSTDISITAKAADNQIQVTTSGATAVALYLNGQYAGCAEVKNGTATLTYTDDMLMTNDTDNTAQVFRLDKNGEEIDSNFIAFADKEGEEGTVTPSPETPSTDTDPVEPGETTLEGTVSIRGNALAGAILYADVNTEATGELTIQWYADGEAIAGASDLFYQVAQADVGKKISVSVTSSVETGSLSSEMDEEISNVEAQTSHIIINQVYGNGGKDGACSHSFIELYNPTDTDIDLEGYGLDYESGDTSEKLDLSGVIPAHTSFLIRCKAGKAGYTYEVPEGDLEWDQVIDNKKYEIRLIDYTDDGTMVDGVSVNGNEVEGTPLTNPANDTIISKNKAIRRINFVDTDVNANDFEVLNYSKLPEALASFVEPKRVADGAWEAVIPAGTVTTPETPSTDLETPSTDPETPSTDPETPSTAKETPSTDEETPSTDKETPSTVTETPATESKTPSNSTTTTSGIAGVKKVKAKVVKVGKKKCVKVTWKKAKGATKYIIYRSTKANKGYRRIAVVKKGSKTTYIDKKVKTGKKYYYRVVAVKNKISSTPTRSKAVKVK